MLLLLPSAGRGQEVNSTKADLSIYLALCHGGRTETDGHTDGPSDGRSRRLYNRVMGESASTTSRLCGRCPDNRRPILMIFFRNSIG